LLLLLILVVAEAAALVGGFVDTSEAFDEDEQVALEDSPFKVEIGTWVALCLLFRRYYCYYFARSRLIQKFSSFCCRCCYCHLLLECLWHKFACLFAVEVVDVVSCVPFCSLRLKRRRLMGGCDENNEQGSFLSSVSSVEE
jgi:hypothetical protein